MYKFSKRSKENLSTADERLQLLFNEVIKEIDCTVIEGHRSLERQKELFDKGASQIDGISRKGKHNHFPSLAVDVVPYPLDWNDIESFKRLASVAKRKASELNINIVWGGDWKNFKDYPHYQL